MSIKTAATLVALAAGAARAQGPEFYQHWGDGQAEVSSYRVVQPRYGQPRDGYAVLIYVTEDLNRKSLIKVESPTPSEDRIYTLKLNHVLKFGTGIYDYSVMTSTFCAVEPLPDGRALEPVRISLTSQEWCGQVFEEVLLRGGKVRGYLNSYFEKEGRQEYELDRPARFAAEDELLIRIRELAGPIMEEGEQQTLTMMPSLWQLRLAHRPRALEGGILAKGNAQQIEAGGQAWAAVPWRWEIGARQHLAWVEQAYPHRILAWEDNQGGRGDLVASMRVPYWSLNHNEDAGYRARLGIP
ncbi:MAG: hypothetical protein ABIL09_19835 [Gemmatimonadota bacterium]